MIRFTTRRTLRPETWLRLSCWVGAAADAFATYRMLFPTLADGDAYRYALHLGAALMLGWTLLLLWASQRPLERKGVVLLTVFPVLSGLLSAELYAFYRGLIPFEKMLPTCIFLVGLIALFSFSYFNARHASNNH